MSRSASLGIFFSSVALVYVATLWIVGSSAFAASPAPLAVGVTLDLAILVPLLYYLIVVRRLGARPITVVPVFIASVMIARRILPGAHHQTLDWLELAVVPAEIALLLFLAVSVTRSLRRRREADSSADFFDRTREIAKERVGSERVADLVAHELSIFYYALAAWRSKPPASDVTAGRFTYHERSGYGPVLLGLLLVAALEMVVVHVLLYRWQPAVAWVVLALSLYSTVWLIGDYRAMRFRLIEVDGFGVRFRLGLRWRFDAHRSAIRDVRRYDADRDETAFKAVPWGDPEWTVEFFDPIELHGPFGVRRSAGSVTFVVDDPDAFRGVIDGS